VSSSPIRRIEIDFVSDKVTMISRHPMQGRAKSPQAVGLIELATWRAGGVSGRYDHDVSNRPAGSPPDSIVVVTNPDEDCSPEAFRAFFDELLSGPEPELESVDAAEALHELRVDAGE
jgi:hypothetical protein